MKHLVTGGGGFLGSALVRRLLEAGDRVRVLDDYSRGEPRRLQGLAAETVHGDVRDPNAMMQAAAGCDIVWHLAYINGTRFFYEKPDEVLEVGVRGTLNAIDAALSARATRFVFASTSETYQTPTHIPTTEVERLVVPDVSNPRFSYGGGKITGELLTMHYAARRGLETVIFRPHNVYGPDMGFEHVIPELTKKIHTAARKSGASKVKIEIQGTGNETRSFCHIQDGSSGAMIAGVSGTSGEIYHLGTEEEVSIAQLTLQIGGLMGVDLEIQPGPLRPGGTNRRCPDISKLRAIGYSPKVGLRSGLADAVKWYVDHYDSVDR